MWLKIYLTCSVLFLIMLLVGNPNRYDPPEIPKRPNPFYEYYDDGKLKVKTKIQYFSETKIEKWITEYYPNGQVKSFFMWDMYGNPLGGHEWNEKGEPLNLDGEVFEDWSPELYGYETWEEYEKDHTEKMNKWKEKFDREMRINRRGGRVGWVE